MAGHQNYVRKKLEEFGIEYRGMASNSEEGHGPHRSVVPMFVIMMMKTVFLDRYIFLNIVPPNIIQPEMRHIILPRIELGKIS
jgi:hypothetical protein